MTENQDVNDYLLPTLDGFRNKLLDLTTRNNLLNLSLASKRTSKLLRFIGCDPQIILNKLCEGAQLELAALPNPPETFFAGDDSEEFELALAKAKELDPIYQQVIADCNGDQNQDLVLAQAEDRVRWLVRENFETNIKTSKNIKNLSKWAESNGIPPSYQLEFSQESSNDSVDKLRVLQLDTSLDRLAEAIRKYARSSIEETGNNILYLAFGCLEWSDKDRKLFAPLILLPVELTKAATRGGTKTYYLRAADESPIGNVTLKERLRRDFLINLPLPCINADGLDLSNYFDEVAKSISDRNDWAVGNLLNLALFNFSGLGLYEDLDPNVVTKSLLVRQLLAAEISAEELPPEIDVVAEDQHVDHPDIAKRVPVLITQADASQFAGIADVMSGRSMVIEGPPGTGKSQTITNIIANALSVGKRVLFVAEKKVALDVVYNRLAEAGLKPYCLRIESDKTNKRDVYDELAQRLQLGKPESPKRDLVIDDFQNLRTQLNNFSELLNTGHGTEEIIPQELFWKELTLRQQLCAAQVPLAELNCSIIDSIKYSNQQIEQISQIFGELSTLCTKNNFELLSSTFTPLGAKPADALARNHLMDLVERWRVGLASLSELLGLKHEVNSLSLSAIRHLAMDLVMNLSKLPEPLAIDQENFLPILSSHDGAGKVHHLLATLKAEEVSSLKLAEIFSRLPDPLPDENDFANFATSWGRWRVGKLIMPTIANNLEYLGDKLNTMFDLLERMQLIASASGDINLLSFNQLQLKALNKLLQNINGLPSWVLDLREGNLWNSNRENSKILINQQIALQKLHQDLGLHLIENEHQFDDAQLQEASMHIRQCCERGIVKQLEEQDASNALANKLLNAEELIDRILLTVKSACLASDFNDLTIAEYQQLPILIDRILALSPNSLMLLDSELWKISLDKINNVLELEQQLFQKRNTLSNKGLKISQGLNALELRAAAAKIESMSPLRKLISRSYAKATKLAKELGCFAVSNYAESLRCAAELIELEENFPVTLVNNWCKDGISLNQAVAVVSEFTNLKTYIVNNGTTAGLFEQLMLLSKQTLVEQKELFSAGLGLDLETLVRSSVWADFSVVDKTLDELISQLDFYRSNLQLLKQVEPYSRWAKAAGINPGEPMAHWIDQVFYYRIQERKFPADEFRNLLGELYSDPAQAHELLNSADKYDEFMHSANINAQGVLLIKLNKHQLEQLYDRLSKQLLPIFEQLNGDQEILPSDFEQLELQMLFNCLTSAISDFRNLVAQLSSYNLNREFNLELLPGAPIEVELFRRRKEETSRAVAEFKNHAGPDITEVNPDSLAHCLAWISNLKEILLPTEIEHRCLSIGSGDFISEQRAYAEELARLILVEKETSEQFVNIAEFHSELHPGSPVAEVVELQLIQLIGWLQQLYSMRDSFSDWVRINNLKQQLPSEAEQKLSDLLVARGLAAELWKPIYSWNLVRNQLSQISTDIPAVKELRAADQVARRERFNRVEDQVRELDRAEVIASIHRMPEELPVGVCKGPKGSFTEMALIANEAVKQSRHRPLRHLFQDAGTALRGLKPCWMMSPSTVASLVPREAIEQFDLVVVDEASQMAPERAFGVISRAKQCVVVGDPKQLPPTSFFQRTSTADDNEQNDDLDRDALDEESILDLCTKSFHPVRRLKWHYRSRHASLIAFSNKHFYNNELIVFPSCDRNFAISRHLVEAPCYGKGVNLPEVKQVCDVVLQQLEIYPNRTIGVVAMNEAQSEEIAEQLEMLSIHHDELRRRLELTDSSEGLFVKSLEKVQGDERDTIVISTTYGPAQPGGGVAMRFGPINQNGGHRRLNVLFTRAKYAIELVTSMESHQIQPTATSSQGVHAFKGYLKYVESQSLETAQQSGREPDSEFEILVAQALTNHGFHVDCQVGVANYFIDLAIRHPNRPETYLLGIECDGATYHSARSARDRDKYRQAVLEGLGWQIYRIWSTDWFENAEAETNKLINHLNKLV